MALSVEEPHVYSVITDICVHLMHRDKRGRMHGWQCLWSTT